MRSKNGRQGLKGHACIIHHLTDNILPIVSEVKPTKEAWEKIEIGQDTTSKG
jgi:hypothetical protein